MKMETATAILTIKRKAKRQKAIKQEVHFKFIRADPDKNTSIFLELSMKYLDISNN